MVYQLMVYQLKEQDVTPLPPDPDELRSVKGDAAAALALALLTAGLIALIIGGQIL